MSEAVPVWALAALLTAAYLGVGLWLSWRRLRESILDTVTAVYVLVIWTVGWPIALILGDGLEE